jgi:uncharacterized PurR-regulated membrane protein YhhQ (DUF165 family)
MSNENIRDDSMLPSPSGERVQAGRKPARRMLWWGILTSYLLMFAVTGYVAFVARDIDPVLAQGTNLMANVSDQQTKDILFNVLRQEGTEHKMRAAMAAQAFSVILGTLLGFLSAPAVSRVTGKSNT